MNALALLRSRIPSFPGYLDEEDRRLSNQLVRSYMGEALARLQERLSPLDASVRERFEELILRAGFTNQVAFKEFESAQLDQTRVDSISMCDVNLLDQADREPEVSELTLSAYLADVRASFDERDRVMEGAAAA